MMHNFTNYSSTFLSFPAAQYYNSDLSIWLSVDPLADKYPNLSPYTYCADNPVRLVDPNGMIVVIKGEEQKKQAFNRLQEGTNLILSMDNNGKITIIEGEVLNKNDEQLLNAINWPTITCEINTGLQYGAGEYNGTDYDADNKTALSRNNVNIVSMMELEKKGAEGSGIIHEITEGYNLGHYSLKNEIDIPHYASEGYEETKTIGYGNNTKIIKEFVPYYPDWYKIYSNEGHDKATKAPNEMTTKEARIYKSPSL